MPAFARRTALLFSLLAALAPLQAQPHWDIQYFYDVAEQQFVIADLAFPSPLRGIAAGYRVEGNRVRGKCVITSNGGKTWTDVAIKEPAVSLFFLNDTIGWMVTEKGVWKTIESGAVWRKISKQKRIERVWFRDEQHGWAVGDRKSIWESSDGGRHWQRLAAAEKVKTTADYTEFNWIDFPTPSFGVILGFSEPPRRGRSRLPEWMEPERAARQREWPTSSIVLQTNDGGKKWHIAITSIFGRLERLRLRPDGSGLALVRFHHAFEWPSEVYRINVKTNVTERSFRDKKRSITDLIFAGETAYLAGFVPPGKLQQMPVPGRLVLLRSDDLKHWREMDVDYRATARRAVLAAAGPSHVWVGTDTGMILTLQPE